MGGLLRKGTEHHLRGKRVGLLQSTRKNEARNKEQNGKSLRKNTRQTGWYPQLLKDGDLAVLSSRRARRNLNGGRTAGRPCERRSLQLG